jgi:hypothetical protein
LLQAASSGHPEEQEGFHPVPDYPGDGGRHQEVRAGGGPDPSTYKKLTELLGDDRVEKAWSVEGRLRFVLMGNDKGVKKVKSVFDSVDQIVTSALS